MVNNVNIALAQSQFGSSISTISLTEGNNNITSQQQQKVHEYTLIAEDTTIEIAPGLRVDAWTYNGTVPGPTLTATEGDKVIIHFINKTPLPHTVHLHGDHPSEQDGVFEQIPANGTYTYDIIAKPAGALAYHCHVPPVMQHVRMGLYGAFIVYPKTPLPPAREYVLVDGEYDTQNQLNPIPEYYMFNGYTEQYELDPLPARTNETVRIYLINLGVSPAYSMHIHGTLFKAYPSGILQNPPLMVQSWEIGSGNTAILEAKLTMSLQKADPHGKVTSLTTTEGMSGMQTGMQQQENASSTSSTIDEGTQPISIVNGATNLGSNAFSPNHIKIKVGSTVIWTNNDNNIHTVTSGTPNTPYVGQAFDSGLTSLIAPSKSYAHKFTNTGDFSYFCRLHPTMVGEIEAVPQG